MMSMEEMKKFIGGKGKAQVFEIDRTMIKRYCECIGDTSPKWHNDVPARTVDRRHVDGRSCGYASVPVPRHR